MSVRNAYSIYDRKALVYHPPFYALADGEACRIVLDIVRDPNTQLGRHPDDFVLYRVGAFDDLSGSLLPVSAIEHITDVRTLIGQRRGPGEQQEFFEPVDPFEITEPAAVNGKS